VLTLLLLLLLLLLPLVAWLRCGATHCCLLAL
jgi:hypothetical protein